MPGTGEYPVEMQWSVGKDGHGQDKVAQQHQASTCAWPQRTHLDSGHHSSGDPRLTTHPGSFSCKTEGGSRVFKTHNYRTHGQTHV